MIGQPIRGLPVVYGIILKTIQEFVIEQQVSNGTMFALYEKLSITWQKKKMMKLKIL